MTTKIRLLHDTVGIPTGAVAVTQSASDNTTKVATTAYVTTALANLADSAPSTLNTLNELAAALGDDANFSTTVTNSIATKAPLATPQFTNRVGIGVAAHGTAGLNITSTAQHMRLNNGSELGVISLESDGALKLWSHGDSNNEIQFYQGSGSGSASMTLDSSGNVGIGETDPDQKLHVNSGTANVVAKFESTDNIAGIMLADNGGNVELSTSGATFRVQPSGGATAMQVRSDGGVAIGSNNAGYSGQILSVKAAAADNVFYGESTDANCIVSLRDNSSTMNIGYGATGNAHVFSQDGAEIARISSSGMLLVNTTSSWGGETTPHIESRGDVAGDYTGLIVSNTNDAASDSVSVNFGLARDGGLVFGNAGKITVGKEQDWTTTPSTIDSFMSFSTHLNESLTEKMRIASDGQLLINQTTSDVGAATNIVEASGNFRLSGGNRTIKFNNGSHEIVGMAQIASNKMQYGSQRLTIDVGNSRVGINNASPDATLSVGDGQSNYVRIDNASSGDVSSGYQIYSGSTLTTQLYGNASEGWTTLLSGGALNFRVNNASSGFNPMGIDTSGRVSMPYQPAFCVYNPGSTYPTAGGSKAFGKNDASDGNYSTHVNVGSHFSTTTGRFTAPIAGNYYFSFSAMFDTGSGGNAGFDFNINDAAQNGGEGLDSDSSTYVQIAGSILFALSANDYVTLTIRGRRIHQRYGSFEGFLVG